MVPKAEMQALGYWRRHLTVTNTRVDAQTQHL